MELESKKRKRDESVDETDGLAKRYLETTNPRDPMYLPIDIRRTILSQLAMSDILNCQSVSEGWDSEIQDWKETHPSQSNPIRQCPLDLVTSNIVYQQFHRPESNLTVGDFNCQIKTYFFGPFPKMILAWKSLRALSLQRDLVLDSIFQANVEDIYLLQTNRDGIILVDARTRPRDTSRTLSRSLRVYSVQSETTIWEHICPHANDNSFEALGLGESRVYCAIQQDNSDEYDFVAIDFHTGKSLYRISIPHLTWDRILPKRTASMVLPPTSYTDETVVITGSVRHIDQAFENDTDMVIVINGKTGHRYPGIMCSPSRSLCCIPDSLTGQFAVTWGLQMSDIPAELSLRVHPFAMVAMDYEYHDHRQVYSQYLTRHPLLHTRDNAVELGASAVAKWFFLDPTTVLVGCFTPGVGVVAKLSRAYHASSGSMGSPPGTKFTVRPRSERPPLEDYTPKVYWTNDASLVVKCPDKTILLGFD
ncbi:hypothetical protein BDW74DRAFT_184191 [Aspergillus multicolor]|uniref:uncharacterized protein n=1 Tax=Aspergillus multicolor TaxID=41759 RepID=UPI003CCD347B